MRTSYFPDNDESAPPEGSGRLNRLNRSPRCQWCGSTAHELDMTICFCCGLSLCGFCHEHFHKSAPGEPLALDRPPVGVIA